MVAQTYRGYKNRGTSYCRHCWIAQEEQSNCLVCMLSEEAWGSSEKGREGGWDGHRCTAAAFADTRKLLVSYSLVTR